MDDDIMKAVTEAAKQALKDTEGDRQIENILKNGEKLADRGENENVEKESD